MTETAVVILNYNGRNFLQQFLPSVIQHSTNASIIVADNGSTDDSIHLLQTEFPSVEVIAMDRNRGFCGGYNEALKSVQATYYVLLNSDVEVTPGWLEPVIGFLNADKTVAAAQPKILAYHQKDEFEYAGAAGGFIDLMGYPFCRGRIFNAIEKDNGQYNDPAQIFWATGACMFIRAEAFHTMGGFDEDFFAHMEEVDLCWRLNRAGHSVYCIPQSTVYHVGGGTLSKSNPRKTQLNFKNGLSLLVKNLPTGSIWWKVPFRILLDWVAALQFLLGGKPGDAWAVLKAHGLFLGGLSGDLRKRSMLATLYPYPVRKVYPRLLVAEHFLSRKGTFKELMIF